MVKFELLDKNKTRLLIAKKGYTIRGFSKVIGISHSYLSQILNTKQLPSAATANKISKGLEKKIEDIFFIKVVDELPVVEVNNK